MQPKKARPAAKEALQEEAAERLYKETHLRLLWMV